MLLAECTTCHSKACLDPGSESQAGSHLPFRIGLLQLGNGVQELFGPKLSKSPWFLRSELGFGWKPDGLKACAHAGEQCITCVTS